MLALAKRSLEAVPHIKCAMVTPRGATIHARACGTGYGHRPSGQSPHIVSAACGGEVTTPATLNPASLSGVVYNVLGPLSLKSVRHQVPSEPG